MDKARESLHDLCLTIAETYYREEAPAFKLIGMKKVQQIYDGVDISISANTKGEFEFGESIKEILSIVQLIIATYLAVKKIVKEIKAGIAKKDKNDFDTKWQEELEKNGIESKQAAKIVKRFKSDFIKVVALNE